MPKRLLNGKVADSADLILGPLGASMSHTPAELATALVNAYGRPDDIIELLADDIVWWITPTVPAEVMPSVTKGRDAMYANLKRVFGSVYNADAIKVTVHSAISERNLGAVRLTMAGEFSRGGVFSNEYCVCVETRDDKIAKVWEYMDMAHTEAQLRAAGQAARS
jgi:ketosteroid isomerase-like protein